MTVPITVVPCRNCTWATVAPVPAVAEAVTVVAVLSESTDPSAGAEIETVGAAALTVTLTADEVTVVPAESVARAVNATVPTALGVHVVV